MRFQKITLLSLVCLLAACSGKHGSFKKINFTHQQGEADYSDSFYYSDEVFEQSATIYNNKLATISLCFAMSSFASTEVDYPKKSKNGVSFLEKCGFSNILTNLDFETKPKPDSFGMIFATKKIKNYTLVAVGTRGSNYESEWASNFTIGAQENGYHQGFEEASAIYLSSLKNYLSKTKISGDIKLWSVGYSRAAATTNVAAGRIDESIRDNSKILGEQIGLKKENFYAYCFEAPQGVSSSKDGNGKVIARGETYSNIFNIINYNDPVPYVAMKQLEFTRYGNDMILPDPLTTLQFDKHFKKLNNIYTYLSNYNILGDYKINAFTYKGLNGFKIGDNNNTHAMTQGLFLQEFIKVFTEIGLMEGMSPKETKEYYVENIQSGLRTIFEVIYGSTSFKGSLIDLGTAMIGDIKTLDEVDYLLSDLQREPSLFIEDLKPILARALNKLQIETDVEVLGNNIVGFLQVVAKTFISCLAVDKTHLLTSWFSKDNISSIASGHYPEVCESHLKALDENYVDEPIEYNMDGKYYHLTVMGKDTAVYIYNNNNLIVKVRDGDEINNNIAYHRKDDRTEIYLPYHENYKVQLSKVSQFTLEYYDQYYGDFIEETKHLSGDNSFSIENK